MKRTTAWLLMVGITMMLSLLLLPTSHAQRTQAERVEASSRRAAPPVISGASPTRGLFNFQLTGEAPEGGGAPLLIAAGKTVIAESCLPPNNVIDPGETVRVSLCILNVGTVNTPDDMTGTLQATGGVTNPSEPQLYGTVVAGGSPACRSFMLTAAEQACGTTITASVLFESGQTSLGTVNYTYTLGAPVSTFVENFDGVVAPALPAGWTSSVSGSGVNWVTTTTTPDTAPNDAFTPNQSSTGEASLISPVIAITNTGAQISFRHFYELEDGFDGGVLEIKIGGGDFTDIIAAGGSFNSGGYDTTLEGDGECPNPLAGRDAWSGNTGNYITTNVNLPPSAAGQNIQLRWRAGFDCSFAEIGWRVDTISLADSFSCCTRDKPAINIVKLTNGTDNNTAPGPSVNVGSLVTFTYNVTNAGEVLLANVAVTDDNGTPGNTGDDFTPTFNGGDTNSNNRLDLTETWTYSASRIATAGQYTNIGTATAIQGFIGDGDSFIVTDTDVDNHFGVTQTPLINLVKLTNGTDNNSPPGPIVAVGSTVTFTYIVTNPGDVPLISIFVTDDNGTPGNMADDFNATFVGGDTNSNGLLETSETWTFTASRIATPGQYTNTATASGSTVVMNTSPNATVTDTDTDNHFGNTAPPQINIDDVSMAEGNGGLTPFNFTVSLTAASSNTVTVQFKTQNGTANVGYAAEDFLPDMGTVTFNPGEVARTVTILVNGDTQVSPDETFFVNLSNPTNATIGDGQGQGTILNDDSTGVEPLPPNAFAISNNNQLLSFNIAFPDTILSRMPITGLAFGETMLTIDFRPANGQLYGFTAYNRLVTINLSTGAVTIIGSIPGLVGDEYGMDFNPTNDRLRLVNNRDQNYLVNPDDATFTVQTPLNPGNPNVASIAYSNNFVGAATTTLYAVDSDTDALYTQNPPANGTLSLVGPLQVNTGQVIGFDIAPVSGVGYVSLSAPIDNAASLYALNLTTGRAHLVGPIGKEATTILDISVSTIPPPNIVGLTTGNNLIIFNSLTPNVVPGPMPINNLINGEVVIGIDYRPSDGLLYGYTSYNRLVRIDNVPTGFATVVGAPTTLNGNEYGFDFNPAADRIRVVNDTDQNVRLNPDDGTLTATDGTLAYAPGDPNTGQNPTITGSAYTNNFVGATATTLYGIDANLRNLVTQNPPNTGTLNTVGPLGVNISPLVGFDIAAGTGSAYAALQPPLGGFSSLFTINLITGRATLIGTIGGFESIRDIAVEPQGIIDFSGVQTVTVNENAGSVTLTVRRVRGEAIAASISYATADGTATAGSDYTATSGTLFFNAGDDTDKTITIPIIDNVTAEPGESFTVTLSNPTGGFFTTFSRVVTVTIADND